jgi:chromosome condensin MukBEF MukE localization factor
MPTKEQIQWEYFNRMRRCSLYKDSYLAKLAKINQIRQFIQMGGCIENSPLYDDYLKLVDESGGMYFIFDDNIGKDVNMTKEEEKV